MQTIAELQGTFPRTGRIEWIGVAHERGGPIEPLTEAFARPGAGIDGEHHCKRRKRERLLRLFDAQTDDESPPPPGNAGSKRQVTLIQQEHLAVVAALLGRDALPPGLLRRNVAVSGINLIGLKGRQFRLGDALLEGTGPCDPCSRMEEILGPGGYNAMRGHGGITARVLEEGAFRVGDRVEAAGAALTT